MSELLALKEKVLNRAAILDEEVTQLAIACYENGVIGLAEAELAFSINQAIRNEQNTEKWSNFFVKIISDFLLLDLVSPGEVDQVECEWLLNKVNERDDNNENVQKLIQYLKNNTTPFPKELESLLDLD